MVMTPGLAPFCRLPRTNHVAQSGAVCSRRAAESKLSPSQAVGTVGQAHAFLGCQEMRARLGDERITSVLRRTEWLIPPSLPSALPPTLPCSLSTSSPWILSPLSCPIFSLQEQIKLSPLTTLFIGLQSRSLCMPWRRGGNTARPERGKEGRGRRGGRRKKKELARILKCHV